MKSLQFRTILFLFSIILIGIIFFLFNPILAAFYIFFSLLSITIVLYLVIFLPIFDIIDEVSSLKYWEIRPDNELHTTIQKIYNFLFSFVKLLTFNFFISINSIFFLYKLDFLSNNPSLLILVSSTIVILIRFLAYLNNEIAKEIGKGFRYAMFPLGFTLFLWDFLGPLITKSPVQSIDIFIKDNTPMFLVLAFALIIITTLEPLFELSRKVRDKFNKKKGLVPVQHINNIHEGPFMFKLQKFDFNDDELRERKLKFIEILLLVGGIIGGVRLQNKNDQMNIIFGFFLIGSILYYFLVSNKKDVKISFEIAILLTALGFSVIAIGPLIYEGMPPTYAKVLILLSRVSPRFLRTCTLSD